MQKTSLTPLQEIFFESGMATEAEAKIMQKVKQLWQNPKLRLARFLLSLLIKMQLAEPSLTPQLQQARNAISIYILKKEKEEERVQSASSKPGRSSRSRKP